MEIQTAGGSEDLLFQLSFPPSCTVGLSEGNAHSMVIKGSEDESQGGGGRRGRMERMERRVEGGRRERKSERVKRRQRKGTKEREREGKRERETGKLGEKKR